MTYQTYTQGEIRPGDEFRREDGCDHCGWTSVNFSIGRRAEDYPELLFRRTVEEAMLATDADWLRKVVEVCHDLCEAYEKDLDVIEHVERIVDLMESRGDG